MSEAKRSTREKMARAAYSEMVRQLGLMFNTPMNQTDEWESQSQALRDDWFRCVDIMLDAMREPSEQVLRIMRLSGSGFLDWQEVIDAIKAGK